MATSETPIKLESRVAILEEKVIQLQRKLEAVAPEAKPWWQYVVGAFANDPAFEEAMRLGESTGSRCVPGSERSHPNAGNLPTRGNVEMLVLDTDHVSVMEWSEGSAQQN